MNAERGNILAALPDAAAGEIFQGLVGMRDGTVRIERIVSDGQSSPPGFWYDQDWDEWVLIISGGAAVELQDPQRQEVLGQGDWLLIPAHCRHRVTVTHPGTVWLAVHAHQGA